MAPARAGFMKEIAALAVMAFAGLFVEVAFAQGFQPTRPIEVVVHTGPGGGSDLLARAVALMVEKEKLLPVRMQVVNKTGGGAAVAAAYLAEKKGDPNTIGFFTGVWLTSPLTSAEARVSLKDLTPVVRLVLEPAVISVKTDAPYKTLADFVAAARQNAGQLKQSGGSITSRDNVVRQLLQKHSGARWAFISFPGGGERVVAPPGIPKENVAYWEDVFLKLTRSNSWRKFLDDNQFEDGYQNAAELARFYDEFTDRMREILKDAGIKTVR